MNTIDDTVVLFSETTITTTTTTSPSSAPKVFPEDAAKKDIDNGGLLKYAAESDDLDEVKRLIQSGVSPNQRDQFGDLALHGAIIKGRTKIVKYLLEKGADPNLTNQVGSTSLHKLVTITSLTLQFDIINLLLKKGADPTRTNSAGLIPEQLSKFTKIKEVLQGDQAVSIKVNIPKRDHGKIIGRGGKNLRELRELTNTQITIPEPQDSNTNIIVKGRKDDVENARLRILELVKPPEDPFAQTDTLRVPNIPKENHRLLIGTAGKTIKLLRDTHNVKITIPATDSSDNIITIQGDVDDITAAMKDINKILAQAKTVGVVILVVIYLMIITSYFLEFRFTDQSEFAYYMFLITRPLPMLPLLFIIPLYGVNDSKTLKYSIFIAAALCANIVSEYKSDEYLENVLYYFSFTFNVLSRVFYTIAFIVGIGKSIKIRIGFALPFYSYSATLILMIVFSNQIAPVIIRPHPPSIGLLSSPAASHLQAPPAVPSDGGSTSYIETSSSSSPGHRTLESISFNQFIPWY
eukprot:gene17522-20908_t